MARVAEYSCRKLSTALPKMTIRTIPASPHSRTNRETVAAATRISSSGLRSWARNSRTAEVFDSVAS
jgi:hypothetical protein